MSNIVMSFSFAKGVPNAQLVKEQAPIAAVYNNLSVAEQNSLELSFELLLEEKYKDLRKAIYRDETEMMRFRELVVNSVMATDIVDKELKSLRNARWEKAFSECASEACEDEQVATDRKATIVIEHLIQASDVSHTMQHVSPLDLASIHRLSSPFSRQRSALTFLSLFHLLQWHIYRKWNEKFFLECYKVSAR